MNLEDVVKETVKIMTGREDFDVEITNGVPVLSRNGEWHIYLQQNRMRFIGTLDDTDLDFINTLSGRREEILKLSCIENASGSVRPFSDQDEGKRWLMCVLESKGFQNVKETPNLCHWDLEAEYAGKKYIFELKNRSFSAAKFGDVALNKEKYDILSHSPARAILVYFWTDKWCMIEVGKSSPTGEIERTSRKTTRFANQEEWEHSLVTWDIQNLHLMDYD